MAIFAAMSILAHVAEDPAARSFYGREKMMKLYKEINKKLHYWQTWQDNSQLAVHYGIVGKRGKVEYYTDSQIVDSKIKQIIQDGYYEIKPEDHHPIIIEYKIANSWGTLEDLGKRFRLTEQMNELLAWVGLGDCDDSSTGMGVMEVACNVVNFHMAKKVIKQDLKNTEFGDYSRIHDDYEGLSKSEEYENMLKTLEENPSEKAKKIIKEEINRRDKAADDELTRATVVMWELGHSYKIEEIAKEHNLSTDYIEKVQSAYLDPHFKSANPFLSLENLNLN